VKNLMLIELLMFFSPSFLISQKGTHLNGFMKSWAKKLSLSNDGHETFFQFWLSFCRDRVCTGLNLDIIQCTCLWFLWKIIRYCTASQFLDDFELEYYFHLGECVVYLILYKARWQRDVWPAVEHWMLVNSNLNLYQEFCEGC